MELEPKKWSCPCTKEEQDQEAQSRGLQSPGEPESSQHNALMLAQKACPCLSCQELKKAPEALRKREPLPTPLRQLPFSLTVEDRPGCPPTQA